MNMHTPELLRQHQRYSEIRARLWFTGKREPVEEKQEFFIDEPEPEEIEPIEAEPEAVEEEPEEIELDDALPSEPKYRSTKAIIDEVLADFPGVTWADLKGERRTREFIIPRHLAMYEIYAQRKNMSLPMIGRLFRRDHTTILSAVRKVERMKMAEDEGSAE